LDCPNCFRLIGSIEVQDSGKVKSMSVYLLMEFTCPKDEERNKKRLKHEKDWAYPYYEKKIKEGVKWKGLGLSDGTGRIVSLTTFETVEDFGKIWNDDEYKKGIVQMSYLVDNFTSRILREVI
jgi:hypothetical protein